MSSPNIKSGPSAVSAFNHTPRLTQDKVRFRISQRRPASNLPFSAKKPHLGRRLHPLPRYRRKLFLPRQLRRSHSRPRISTPRHRRQSRNSTAAPPRNSKSPTKSSVVFSPSSVLPSNPSTIAVCCFPARAVGGDYYDFLDLGPDRFGLVIADVSGKGIAAALLMANLQANLRSQCAISLDQPQRLLCAVNQLFSQNTPDGAFATLFLADYHIPTGRLRYVNCGHPAALILRCDDSIDRLDPTATVLGIFKKWECEIGERTIHPGDTLALYTDGITEAFNENRDEFGEDRLIESLRRHRAQPSQSLLNSIVADVRQFSPREQHDDITLIIAKSALSSV